MSRAQRLTFLGIAVVIAVVAVIVLADSSEDSAPPPANKAATATPTQDQAASPQDTPTPTPTAEPPPLLTGAKVTKLRFTEDETVRFRVRSDVPEEVHIHGYDIAKGIEANTTTTISFKATITGIFEIEFEHAKHQIAELRVDPK